MYNDVCECSACDTGPPLNEWERVQRWDVYDIADELADLPGMLHKAAAAAEVEHNYEPAYWIRAKLEELVARLWAAADRGGSVGPAPEYLEA